MFDRLIKLSRANKQIIMIATDYSLVLLILFSSFSLRLGYWYFPETKLILGMIIIAPLIAIPIFFQFGMYRAVIRYVGFKALWAIVKAVSLYALVWGIFAFMVSSNWQYYGIPRSVVLINLILTILMICGVRVFASFLINRNIGLKGLSFNSYDNLKCRVMIYGAGGAGIQLVSALESSSHYQLVGLIDDSKDLEGNQIRGLTVSSSEQISTVIKELKVNEVLIAMPSISRAKRLAIIDKLAPYPVVVRILPGMTELAQGKVSIDDLRSISIKDLLGRSSAEANKELLGKNITDKVVTVTGAGGSIGSELCRQIVLLKPKILILYEMSELALYSIEKELSNKNFDSINIYPIMGSVNNKNRLSNVFKRFDVDTIYHAAAYKHVPMVEFNSTEGVYNNIFGTLHCVQAAIDAGVETFVLISTDKAVRPTNTMGATKRIAELILQALSADQTDTHFSIVRFGNVLGSSGSVIPLFKQQIKSGGPVTVTDKNIIRYFMSITESVELVIQAGAMGKGGEVFVLDMGKPILIKDLAEKMIKLSGLEVKNESHPDGDIEIKYTGLRPGEKLYEELLIGDNVSETDNPLIMRAQEDMLSWSKLGPALDELSKALDDLDQAKLRKLLIQIVPDFKPQSEIRDILYLSSSID